MLKKRLENVRGVGQVNLVGGSKREINIYLKPQALEAFGIAAEQVVAAVRGENQNLPGYVVMLDPRGGPIPGAPNWGSGFMEAQHQGTVFRTSGQPVLDLQPYTLDPLHLQRQQLQALQALDRPFRERHPEASELEARMASYELAFQLQASAPEALDLSTETRRTQELYGLFDDYPAHRLAVGPATFGRQCLIARRLIERGVRFVQIYSGGGHQQQNWDAHFGVEENLTIHCPEVDRPMAALLQDLEQRGLLDETLIVWGGEFGRQPVSQGDQGGRMLRVDRGEIERGLAGLDLEDELRAEGLAQARHLLGRQAAHRLVAADVLRYVGKSIAGRLDFLGLQVNARHDGLPASPPRLR